MAQRDIDRLLHDSRDRFGDGAVDRYRRLLDEAFAELLGDPQPPTSRVVGGDLRIFRLQSVARRLPATETPRSPPHVIVYRFKSERVTVVRVLHAAMDLPRRLAGEGDADGG